MYVVAFRWCWYRNSRYLLASLSLLTPLPSSHTLTGIQDGDDGSSTGWIIVSRMTLYECRRQFPVKSDPFTWEGVTSWCLSNAGKTDGSRLCSWRSRASTAKPESRWPLEMIRDPLLSACRNDTGYGSGGESGVERACSQTRRVITAFVHTMMNHRDHQQVN